MDSEQNNNEQIYDVKHTHFQNEEAKKEIKREKRISDLVKFIINTIETTKNSDTKQTLNFHTRIPDLYIPREWAIVGKSKSVVKSELKNIKIKIHNEHVVPLLYLINKTEYLYNEDKSNQNEIIEMWLKCYKIVIISKDEASIIDKQHKTTMPENWNYKTDSEFFRLENSDINFLTNDEIFFKKELARVGTINETFDLIIYPEPSKIPSFHIQHSDFEITISIKDLSILEIEENLNPNVYQFKKGDQLPALIIDSIISFMNTKIGPLNMTSRKDFLIQTWNMNNPEAEINLIDINW